MKISRRERRLLLGLAGIVLVIALRGLWRLASPGSSLPPAPAVTAAGARPARGGRHAAAPVDHVIDIHLDRLEPKQREFAVGRDLFRFAPPPPPPPPPPPSAADLARLRREAEQRAAEAARPHPPPVTLSYLGSFGPEASKIAVFTGPDGKIYDAREGDVVAGAFVLAHIGYESVDLKFVGFPDVPAQRLPLAQ